MYVSFHTLSVHYLLKSGGTGGHIFSVVTFSAVRFANGSVVLSSYDSEVGYIVEIVLLAFTSSSINGLCFLALARSVANSVCRLLHK